MQQWWTQGRGQGPARSPHSASKPNRSCFRFFTIFSTETTPGRTRWIDVVACKAPLRCHDAWSKFWFLVHIYFPWCTTILKSCTYCAPRATPPDVSWNSSRMLLYCSSLFSENGNHGQKSNTGSCSSAGKECRPVGDFLCERSKDWSSDTLRMRVRLLFGKEGSGSQQRAEPLWANSNKKLTSGFHHVANCHKGKQTHLRLRGSRQIEDVVQSRDNFSFCNGWMQ